ncbi:hypothetical protein WJ973_15560 [Achromobacter xylosoxidans]
MGVPPGRARAGQSALLPGTGGVSIWGLQLARPRAVTSARS